MPSLPHHTSPRTRPARRRVWRLALCALLLGSVMATPLGGAFAAPSASPATTGSVDAAPSLEASLVPVSPAVPITGALAYTTDIRCSAAPSYLQARLSLERPGGRLVYRKTLIAPSDSDKDIRLEFERELSDLSLRPGAHPVSLEVRAEIDGQLVTREVKSTLLVYGSSAEKVPTALVIRLCALPFTDPSGVTVVDPATVQQARADAETIAGAILADPRLRLTLAIPPVALQEWRRVAGGYTLRTSAGETPVPETSAVPQTYRSTLSLLERAAATGRLELLSLGYADPDLARLDARGLSADVTQQYALGASAMRGSLAASASAGTAPPAGLLTPGIAATLPQVGISYVAVSQRSVRSGESTVASNVYRMEKSPLQLMVGDDEAGAQLLQGTSARLLRLTYDRSRARRQPVIAAVELGPTGPTASQLLATALPVMTLPWVAPETLSSLGSASPRSISLAEARADARGEHWDLVVRARRLAGAFATAGDPADPEALRATASSLIAEAACWLRESAGGEDARGAAFASDAETIAGKVLSAISVDAAAVTLPGAKGDVPVTVDNATDKTLTVQLSISPGTGMRVKGRPTRQVTLRPQENFFEIPVDLGSSLSGTARIEVVSAGYVIDATDVTVKASYLDRLAIIGGIVFLLGILLAFIVRRVRRAEADGDADV